jgi:hypothetical protein
VASETGMETSLLREPYAYDDMFETTCTLYGHQLPVHTYNVCFFKLSGFCERRCVSVIETAFILFRHFLNYK